jgi:hypothetical protein
MSEKYRHAERMTIPRFDILESRELQSVLVAPLRRHPDGAVLVRKAAHAQAIKGSLSGQDMQISGSDLEGQESLTGSGQASSLGAVTFAGQLDFAANGATAAHSISYTNGIGTLTASGGQLSVSFSGTGKHQGPGSFSLVVRGSVTGGTGQYAGATGSFSGKGTINDSANTFSLAFSLKLSST